MSRVAAWFAASRTIVDSREEPNSGSGFTPVGTSRSGPCLAPPRQRSFHAMRHYKQRVQLICAQKPPCTRLLDSRNRAAVRLLAVLETPDADRSEDIVMFSAVVAPAAITTNTSVSMVANVLAHATSLTSREPVQVHQITGDPVNPKMRKLWIFGETRMRQNPCCDCCVRV